MPWNNKNFFSQTGSRPSTKITTNVITIFHRKTHPMQPRIKPWRRKLLPCKLTSCADEFPKTRRIWSLGFKPRNLKLYSTKITWSKNRNRPRTITTLWHKNRSYKLPQICNRLQMRTCLKNQRILWEIQAPKSRTLNHQPTKNWENLKLAQLTSIKSRK